jgi:DNA-binding PadR family transcriptional regulator
MFDAGALRLVVLGLIAEQSRHGYDIIRALKDRFQGAYSPSPGSIYPMLQMLEEAGLVTAKEEGGKRLIAITEAGLSYLEDNAAQLAKINAQLEEAAGPIGESAIGEAIMRLRGSLFQRMRSGSLTAEQAEMLREILAKAADEIEKL